MNKPTYIDVKTDHYDEIADELGEELNGHIEHCDYDDRDCILWSDPANHPGRRYSPNNVAIVYLNDTPSKAQIKTELLGYWFIKET